MARRSLRMHDLLQELGFEPDFTRFERNFDRTVRKDELQELATEFGLSDEGTVPELRSRIRDHLVDEHGVWTNTVDKEDTTSFSTRELFVISRALEDESRMSADDIIQELGTKEVTTRHTVKVNGEEKEVTQYGHISNAEAPGFDEALMWYFGNRERLILFFDWDPDECSYHESAALEYKKGYRPHEHWKKDSYIYDIELIQEKVTA